MILGEAAAVPSSEAGTFVSTGEESTSIMMLGVRREAEKITTSEKFQVRFSIAFGPCQEISRTICFRVTESLRVLDLSNRMSSVKREFSHRTKVKLLKLLQGRYSRIIAASLQQTPPSCFSWS